MPTAVARAGLLLALGATLGACAHRGHPSVNELLAQAARDEGSPRLDPLAGYPLSPVETALVDDTRDDRSLQRFDLLDAAIIASGVRDEAELKSWRARFLPALDRIAAQVKSVADPEERGRKLHELLHRDLLGTYAVDATRLTDVLERRQFNCVSSTVLYNYLADRSGLLVKAILVPGHVYTLLFAARGPIEVENTTPGGFGLQHAGGQYVQSLYAREMRRSESITTGDNLLTLDEDFPATEIDNLSLASLILSNRAIILFESGREEVALALVKRASLLAEPARAAELSVYMIAILNNRALKVLEAGDAVRALQILDAALAETTPALAGVQARLNQNRAAAAQRAVQAMHGREAHVEALKLVNRSLRLTPQLPALHELRAVVYNNWGQALFQEQRYADAVTALQQGVADEPEQPVLRQNLARALYNVALLEARAGRCGNARELAARGAALHTQVEGLEFEAITQRCGTGQPL